MCGARLNKRAGEQSFLPDLCFNAARCSGICRHNLYEGEMHLCPVRNLRMDLLQTALSQLHDMVLRFPCRAGELYRLRIAELCRHRQVIHT